MSDDHEARLASSEFLEHSITSVRKYLDEIQSRWSFYGPAPGTEELRHVARLLQGARNDTPGNRITYLRRNLREEDLDIVLSAGRDLERSIGSLQDAPGDQGRQQMRRSLEQLHQALWAVWTLGSPDPERGGEDQAQM